MITTVKEHMTKTGMLEHEVIVMVRGHLSITCDASCFKLKIDRYHYSLSL